MTRPLSVLLPCLADQALLATCLPALLAEVEARAAGDEVLVIDDSGEGVLQAWLAEHHPAVRCLTNEHNLGYGRSLLEGARAARHALLFCLNPDVIVRPGCFTPLVEALDEPGVGAAAPLVLLRGQEVGAESLSALEWRDAFPSLELGVDQDWRPGEGGDSSGPIEVCFALGGASLLRREELLAKGGFDSLYEPFYWEDVDHSWSLWRQGRRVVVEPRALVEHHHRGSIGPRLPLELVRAAIEKNRLLFTWKFLDQEALIDEHLLALERRLFASAVLDDREALIWFLTALDQLEELRERRAELPAAGLSFGAIQRRARPRGGA